jgi:S-adenosylmethionine synthetase
MLYAAEYVLPGHPDKLCDAIADALVEEAARREKRALCGIEAAVHRSSVFITGRIACRGAARIPIKDIVRECYCSAGYGADWRPSPQELDVRSNLCLGPLLDGEASFREVSDDQSIITGYAIDSPGTNFLPPEHWLASRLARRLEALRTGRPDLRLGPDGKLALLFDAEPGALVGFTASVQQAVGGDEIELNRAVRQCVARPGGNAPGSARRAASPAR